MIPALSRVRQSSPAELQAFDTTCARLGGFDPEISFEWVDGFLAASERWFWFSRSSRCHPRMNGQVKGESPK